MSVYTQPRQVQQPLGQQLQQPLGQQFQQPSTQQFEQPLTQLPIGVQQPVFQGYPQQQYIQQPQFRQAQFGQPQTVTELALRCAVSAVSAVVDQLRIDPQAVMGIQAQGQIPPHTWNNALAESARRIAPLLQSGCPQVAQAQYGQIQPQQITGQIQPQGMYPQQQVLGQLGGIPQAAFVPQAGFVPRAQYTVDM